MNRSKKVRHGTPVVLRQGKWIRCRKGQAPQGVWNDHRDSHIFTDRGLINVHAPEGVVVWGVAEMRMA